MIHKMNCDEVYNIRNKVLEAFKEGGYPEHIMLSILATIILEHLFANDPSGKNLDEYFEVTRQCFDTFKGE